MKTNEINTAMRNEQPWWSVRTSLLATLLVLAAVLVSMFTPTPLNEWVFGEGLARIVAGR